MSHHDHDIDQELRGLYRSRARGIDTSEFTDELGRRLARTRKRPRISRPVRITALAAVALLIATAVGVGTLQAVKHLGGSSPVLVLGAPTEPSEGGGQTDSTSLPSTTVTTLAPDEVGSESVDEQSGQADAPVPVPTQQARDIADAVVEQFPQFRVASATETREGNMILAKIELSAAQSGGGTVSIDYVGPVRPISEEGSTATTLVPDPSPEGAGPTVTHPEIPGATATYLIEYPDGEYPDGVTRQLFAILAKFPAGKEINVTSVAAGPSSRAPLDGEQLRAIVLLVYENAMVVYPAVGN